MFISWSMFIRNFFTAHEQEAQIMFCNFGYKKIYLWTNSWRKCKQCKQLVMLLCSLAMSMLCAIVGGIPWYRLRQRPTLMCPSGCTRSLRQSTRLGWKGVAVVWLFTEGCWFDNLFVRRLFLRRLFASIVLANLAPLMCSDLTKGIRIMGEALH